MADRADLINQLAASMGAGQFPKRNGHDIQMCLRVNKNDAKS